jgi:hypothetical protein
MDSIRGAVEHGGRAGPPASQNWRRDSNASPGEPTSLMAAVEVALVERYDLLRQLSGTPGMAPEHGEASTAHAALTALTGRLDALLRQLALLVPPAGSSAVVGGGDAASVPTAKSAWADLV